MESRNGIIYEFANFRLIPGEGLLLHDGEPVPLSLKAFATLVFLVERHGHLVQKAELIEEVWENAFVEEAAVSRCVWTIRHALGEDSKGSRFIQTMPRRGYRFVFPVSVITNSPEPFRLVDAHRLVEYRAEAVPGAEKCATNGTSDEISVDAGAAQDLEGTIEDADKGQRDSASQYDRRRIPSWGSYAGVLALLVGGVALYFALAGQSILGKGDVTRIAVLPLKPVDARMDDPVYNLGLPEVLILKLGKDKKLTVRQLAAVRAYADVEEDPIAAGNDQSVDYVLSGNYQISNGKIRVTAQFFDVATGKVEGTFTSDYDATDSFAAQDAIANNIGNQLLARFGSAATEFKSKRGTSNEEAYRSYQLAMALLAKSGRNNRQAALDYLDRAIALDPNYARAWAGKAYAHVSNVWTPRDREQIPKAMDALQKALAIDPDLSETQTALCDTKFSFEYDATGAEAACSRAVALDPNSSLAHLTYSRLLNSRSRFDEAFTEINTALDLDPASFLIQRHYANVLYHSRRYPEAEEQYKRVINLNPQNDGPYERLIRVLDAQGKQTEAFDYLIRLSEVHKETPETIERLKAAYAKSGWHGALTERIRTAEAESNPDHYNLAGWYAALGNRDKAFENIEKAYQERHVLMMVFSVDLHYFDSLHDDPRYLDLIRRLGGK